MDHEKLMQELSITNEQRIVLLVMDGLGDLPGPKGLTPLEAARTPNLDALALKSALGLGYPVGRGITPGSGPGHLGLFGLDPLKYDLGRGILSALGVGLHVKPDQLACRGNFCSLDDKGNVTDRRAGRIADELNHKLTAKINEKVKQAGGFEVFVKSEKDYRFVAVFTGDGLAEGVGDTDPQETGVPPLECKGEAQGAEKTAAAVNDFIAQVREVIKDEHPANGVLLRGFAKRPDMPTMASLYKVKALAIAAYPMYKGVARLLGMDAHDLPGETIDDEVKALKERSTGFDYIFFHVKKTDSYGEDGNFDAKVHVIEEVDEKVIPALAETAPDVLAITGDHSTPCALKSHSWHPVPVLLSAPHLRRDPAERFNETECLRGSLGHFPMMELMPMMMAHAGKLLKYGA